MNWQQFTHKRVALLGAGKENLSVLSYLLSAGAIVTLCQARSTPDLANIQEKYPNLELVIGEDWLEYLAKYDVVFRTPSLPVATLQQKLTETGSTAIITSPMDLFVRESAWKTIGVTGTKGKGTTVTMIASILSCAKLPNVVAGNIGTTIYDQLDQLTEQHVVILELSSFQLEDMKSSPDIAVLLAMSPDHLQPLSAESPNYHKSMDEYVEAKAQITLHQQESDAFFCSLDSTYTERVAKRSPARVQTVAATNSSAKYHLNEDGTIVRDGKEWLSLVEAGIHGIHLQTNAMFAAAVADELGIERAIIFDGLRQFVPLPHRMETVATIDGVVYVDDSYATNPEAAQAALTAYSAPIVWIAGGSSKGAEFDELGSAVARSSLVQLITVGQEASKIAAAVRQFMPKLPFQTYDNFRAAVLAARDVARPGDVVLLSPACASKDMFRNAAERGDTFQEIVRSLKEGK